MPIRSFVRVLTRSPRGNVYACSFSANCCSAEITGKDGGSSLDERYRGHLVEKSAFRRSDFCSPFDPTEEDLDFEQSLTVQFESVTLVLPLIAGAHCTNSAFFVQVDCPRQY